MPIKFADLEFAFDFANAGSYLGHEAYVSRHSDQVICYSEETADIEPLPDDIDEEGKYVRVPDKRELDLGSRLVMRFASEYLPDDLDEVESIFRHKGAYAQFKLLLGRRRMVDQWHEFENKATEEALREWAKGNGIELVD